VSKLTEAQIEAILEARVMRRLATDSEYRNAENAEQQADREAEITREITREITSEWNEQHAND
jgi:hypothetical protein